MSKNLFDKVFTDIQSQLSVNIETLAQEEDISCLVKNSIQKFSEQDSFSQNDRDRVYNELLQYGPIQSLLKMEGVNEILINNANSIWYELRGEMRPLGDQFYSKISFDNFIHRICYESKITIDLAQPTRDASWKHFRLHIIRPPLTQSTCMSLRGHPSNPWSFKYLQQSHWSCSEGVSMIQELTKSKKSFLIIGPTGSGKTSVLNSCLKEVGEYERCVILEDTNEISLPNELSVKLLARQEINSELKDYSLSDLVQQSLRMRPDRIIVGEMRGSEAKDFLMALSTGHGGGISTLHADNPKQALLRLEMLIQLGAPQWSLHSIRALIHLGLSHIICLNKNRTLRSIHKVSSLESNGLLLECLFKRERERDCMSL